MRAIILGLSVLSAAACTCPAPPLPPTPPPATAPAGGARPAPQLEAVARKAGEDGVELRQEAGQTLILVTSRMGIGGLVLRSRNGAWPERIIVRLRYASGHPWTMLESLRVETDRYRAASAQGRGEPVPLQPRDPAAAAAAIVEIPIHPGAGYMEVVLPAAIFAESPREVRIEWIDAYRG